MKALVLSAILFLSLFSGTYAIELSPETKISLLTCAPGDEIYSYFGHSAIRINDPKSGIDYVFNYGIFSFDSPNFILRFIKGETDYMLAGQRMPSFIESYVEEHRSVYEQILRISQQEKQTLFDALMENAKKENRVYRYRHFSDNCSTRVRDQFEKCVNHSLRYDTTQDKHLSYRQLIDQCVPVDSWNGFGIKIALGIPCDHITTFSEKMFLPDYLMRSMAGAKVVKETNRLPFAEPAVTIYQAEPVKQGFDLASPPVVINLLFLIVFGLTLVEYKRKRRMIWLDLVVFIAAGIAGLILTYLCFFSVLEATGWNLNLIWALPTHLIFALLLVFPSIRSKILWYFKFTAILLTLFLLSMPFLPQTFHWLIIPLCLIIMLRCGINILITGKMK